MKSIRNHTQFVGILALTLVCLSFAAVPASAAMGSGDFDSARDMRISVRDQISDAFSNLQDTVVAFILDIGSIFAGQEGVQILD